MYFSYTKSNGDQAALIVKKEDDDTYSSIAFLQPYDVTTYKFVRSWHNKQLQ